MVNSRFTRFVSFVITLVLVSAFAVPASALAEQTEVVVDNYIPASDQPMISGLVIDDVDAPQPGATLDDTAKVVSAEGVEWEIPVLWIADSFELTTEAQEGRSYLPALVFYVPQGYAVADNAFTVMLSDSLTELFGGREVVSVHDSATGITYILPASLKDFFANARRASDEAQQGWEQAISQEESEQAPSGPGVRSLVDIYCAQTARDMFTDEDLEFILDLIIYKLEPQAVELLLDSFPAFRAAADQGQVGKEIGLYVYYMRGDEDGVAEHGDMPANALAYVRADAVVDGGSVAYCYMIGIDLSSLVQKDENDIDVIDPTTGKLVLVREGESMVTFENTIVHELFHAIMDDYNRTGMLGATDIRNAVTDENGNFPNQELEDLYKAIHYPNWFIEGTASSVENVYQFRYDMFKMLRAQQGSETVFTEFYDKDGLLYNYLNATLNNKNLCFDLGLSSGYDENGDEVDASQCSYESGYLATLYLSELAAQKTVGSAIKEAGDTVTISSDNLRIGLNSILERMHNGETMDQVVNDLSPVGSDGKKLYADTNDFEAKFIKGVGEKTADGMVYYGDDSSLEFVTTFLNYMVALENTMEEGEKPNGSILMDFATEQDSPLDSAKDSESAYLQIVEENGYVESTVPNEVALAGGGKSDSGSVADSDDATKMAAKAAQNDYETAEGTTSDAQAGEPDASTAEEPYALAA